MTAPSAATAQAEAHPAPARHPGADGGAFRRLVFAYLQETECEVLGHLRRASFIVPALLLPMALYATFLATGTGADSAAQSLYWLADYTSFAAIVPALSVFALDAALDRDTGFARLRRILPAPPFAPFAAKAVLAALCAALNTALLILLQGLAGRALPGAGSGLALAAAAMLGTLPFSALGLLIGMHISGKPAILAVNVLILPIGLGSGLLLPQRLLPGVIQNICLFSPAHDMLVLAVAAVRPDMPASAGHLVCLIASALVLGALADWQARRRA